MTLLVVFGLLCVWPMAMWEGCNGEGEGIKGMDEGNCD